MNSPKISFELNRDNYRLLVKRYRNNSAAFLLDVLKFPRLDPWQYALCRAIDQGRRKIAIASCHSSGKTLICSALTVFLLLTRKGATSKVTSATETQLKTIFVKTIGKVISDSLIHDWFNVRGESISFKGIKTNDVTFLPWNIKKPEAFAGIHCETPFFIYDEASSIPIEIIESSEGSSMHPGFLQVLIGNPLWRQGPLFDAFHSKKNSYYRMQISAYDSSFISLDWINEKKAEYGEDSDFFKVRVLGQFPDRDIDVFIQEEDIRSAVNRDIATQNHELKIGGLDIGRYRDASELCIRQGAKKFPSWRWKTTDTMKVAQEVTQVISDEGLDILVIDANGIGAGVSDRIRQLNPDLVLVEVDLTNSSLENDKEYFNKRARLWGLANNWLKYGSINNDPDLIVEGSSLLFSYDKDGRIKLESKKDAKERGVGSPDRFDAFTYTFGVPIAVEAAYRRSMQDKANKRNTGTSASHRRGGFNWK